MRTLFAVMTLLCLAACGPDVATVASVDSSEGDSAEGSLTALARPGMGATVYDGGTTFRVWAPSAQAVSVGGEFNRWSTSASVLKKEAGGLWALDVDGAKAGQQYKFAITSSAGTAWKADPRSKQMAVDASGNSVIHDSAYAWQSPGFVSPPFNEQVIYEIHLATFSDTGTPGSGTWKSAMAKLDYLVALGVTTIEVLPPAEFPGNYSWGYNPSYPFAPEVSYGTPDDAKAFIDRAHALGLGVIIDVVHNHWGPGELSMWCFDGNCLGAKNGGAYFYTDARRETGFGPRPDFGRAEVRNYIVDNATMWLGEYKVDGLRWDSVVNIRRGGGADLPDGWSLLQRANDAAQALNPKALIIAEDLQNDGRITSSTATGGAGFDSQWDPTFYYPIRAAVTASTDAKRSMANVSSALSHTGGHATRRILYTENHDQVAPQNGGSRLPVMIGGPNANKLATLAGAVMLTTPGVPMLFMGQENLDVTPFPFGKARGVDWSAATTNAGTHQLYTDLIALRRNAKQTSLGLTGENINVFHTNSSGKVLAWHRFAKGDAAGDDVVVIANFSAHPFTAYQLGLPRAGRWHVRFNSDSTRYGADVGGTHSDDFTTVATPMDGFTDSGTIGVGAYSLVILSQ